MEELRSSEALDREILEDARKKAFKILKTADDSLAVQTKDWDKKILDSVESLQKTYAERKKRSVEEILARLPLDKRRLRSEAIESFLVKAMDDFLKSLSREKLLSILGNELSRLLVVSLSEGAAGEWESSGEKPELLFSGMNKSEIRGVLEKAFSAFCSITNDQGGNGINTNFENWELKEDRRVQEFPSVVINTRFRKISASVESAVLTLMKDQRAELAAALLGEGVLGD